MVGSLRQRWPLFAISLLGLIVGLASMGGLLRLSAPPPGYPENPILYPARVGPAVVGSAEELRFLAQSRPAGSMIEVRSDAGLLRTRLQPQVSRFHLAIILLEGLIFLGVSLLVFAPRADRGPVRDLYWCTLLYGVATLIHGLHYPRSAAFTEWLFPAIHIICLTAIPVFFFRMSQTFPRPRRLLDRYPRLMPALWIAAGVLALWQIVAAYVYFGHPSPRAWAWLDTPRTIAEVLMVLGVGLGCLSLYRSGRKLDLAREREQTRWILWGITFGVAPYVLLRALPRLAGFTSAVPPEMDRVFELAIPFAFTFAVVRYRFLDIDIIIRRSLIYSVLTGVLVAAYLVASLVLVKRIAAHSPGSEILLSLLAVAVPVLLYVPARRWIATWVDRTFFRTQYDYAQALRGFQEAMRGAASQEEIVEQARAFLGAELNLDTVSVIARRGSALVTSPGHEALSGSAGLLEAAARTESARRLLARPSATTRPDMESPSFPAPLADAGYQVAMPLGSNDHVTGAIMVGEKRTERRFIEEDLRLLYAVRSETEAALDRVDLVQRASAEVIAREREEDLERVKSEFFARVAHDLRTPLTSIRWTVQNLIDGVRSSPDSDPVPQLQAVDVAAGQLARLVNNLLDLSRLEQPGARAESARVDLLPVVQEAVATVEPSARARNIRFDVSVSPRVRPVSGDRGQLLEIVTNLLENAARYSPDGQTVDVQLEPNGEGQMLVVRDRGPGISESERERIFQRFEQGRPSPYTKGRGFGLGL
ncbi:MAG TPA: HAMP domain-containing sensor histidine kinase, partial [Candidatus Polarisedimenticolia bacterium]|nr:HAMP domain-containing sensor histidine kinase [Candidatus Polarisedimenticolia bacterium]